ncbi:MAG: AMP-binding protein [Microthrixaceae bacterium]
MLLHDVVDFAARRTPHETALVAEGRRWSFEELSDRIEFAAESIAATVRPGEVVAVVSDNRPDMVVAMYAIPRAGAVAAFVNTRLAPPEIGALLADVGATRVLRGEDADRWWERDATVPQVGPLGPGGHTARPDDTAWIIHTSGTTGTPKGARLTHRSLLAGVTQTALMRPLGDGDTYLFPFPLFHVASYNVIHAHLRGRPVVLVPKFDAVEVMTAIERHRVTHLSLAPTMIAMLLDHPDRGRFDLTSLRHLYYGASAIPLEVLRRAIDAFGCGFGQGYGMTELSGNVTFLDAEAHRRALGGEEHLLAAAGRPGPLASLRIVHDDDGGVRDVEPGEPGEILVRGDQVIPGYWNRPGADAFVDGWFRTGDIGRVDHEGFVFIVDRRKDIIVSGGENVSSLEVESTLSGHPAVAAAAVVGLADDRWGERVVAVAVRSSGDTTEAGEVLEWCRGRIAGFKRPRQLLWVDELPQNASGKVLKAEVRDLVRRRLGER